MADDREHFRQYLIDEFLDNYKENRVSRRDSLKLLAGVTGSMSGAAALLAACSPAPAPAPTAAATTAPTAAATATAARPANTPVPDDRKVAATDPAIKASMVTFPNGSDQISAYVAYPSAGNGPFPVVLVCHENRGLTEHIQDVARRFGKSGYVGVAVDLLSREGGTAKAEDAAIPGMLTAVSIDRHVTDFQAALAWAKTQPYANKDRIGMTDYCFGGGVTWLTASKTPELKAAVPFYGPAPADPKVLANVKANVWAVYAGLDERVNASIPAVEEALKEGKVNYQVKKYDGAQHAFHNDTNAAVYNAAQAKIAWTDTLAWMDKYLKG